MIKHLNDNEFNPYYGRYIEQASSKDIVSGLRSNMRIIEEFFLNIPDDKHEYAYQADKWTIKDILLHVMDTERVFAYRALRIARGDKSPLPGFDQDEFVIEANASKRSMSELIEEYRFIRNSTFSLFKSFDDDILLRLGTASNSSISVRAIGYILVGHENHHMSVIKERYL